jgi:hypothetical protein
LSAALDLNVLARRAFFLSREQKIAKNIAALSS